MNDFHLENSFDDAVTTTFSSILTLMKAKNKTLTTILMIILAMGMVTIKEMIKMGVVEF